MKRMAILLFVVAAAPLAGCASPGGTVAASCAAYSPGSSAYGACLERQDPSWATDEERLNRQRDLEVHTKL